MAQVTAIRSGHAQHAAGHDAALHHPLQRADVPILQTALSSKSLTEQQLYDLASNFIRPRLATIQGARFPGPTAARSARSSSISTRRGSASGHLAARRRQRGQCQNLILPQGTAKIGDREYDVSLNSSPKNIEELNDLPVKIVNGAMVYVRDVAYVHDGYSLQTNIVAPRWPARRAAVVLKNGKASTLDIVARARCAAQDRRHAAARNENHAAVDQSIFVRGGHQRRAREARDRRRPDGADDSALPGELAQHAGRGHLHSALDSDLVARAEPARRDHQHHDPGRAGARRRHPRGRRHGGDREHQPPDARGHAPARNDSHRRAADRRPGLRGHARASASCSCRSFS